VRVCAAALLRIKAPLWEEDARVVIGRMNENNQLCKTLDPLLLALSHQSASPLDSRVTDAQRAARVEFWSDWYAKSFGKALKRTLTANEKTDEDILAFLLDKKARAGDRLRGGQVYEHLQCNTCHGGGVNPGREGGLFGPDLAGATRRLSPREFAEALVYPSKEVADRYKAYEITLKNGNVFSGFITEQNDSSVTLAARDQVHRLARSEIESIRLQSISLMPDHLLNALSWEQIKDLVAFLEEGPVSANSKR
jgi:putative heme-binding domain-containing protein